MSAIIAHPACLRPVYAYNHQRAAWRSTHLSLVHASRCGRIILIVAPGRVMEMNDEIAVVGGDRLMECNRSYATPILERPPFERRQSVRLALIGHLDVERERPFRRRIAAFIDLRHDLVAKI
jgi:hypothetical protein